MPLEEFRRITTQAFADTQNVKKRLEKEGWEILTVDATAGRTQPTRTFQDEFERSVRGEWEVVKKELEQLLLGAGSQHRVVSIQITNRLCVNSRVRVYSLIGQSIGAASIRTSTS